MNTKILIIDDEEKKLREYENTVVNYFKNNCIVSKEQDGENVIEILSNDLDLKIILIDKFLGNDNKDGITVAKEIKDNFENTYIILITAFGYEDVKGEKQRKKDIQLALEQKTIDYFIEKDQGNTPIEIGNALDAAIESLRNPSQREQFRIERLKTLAIIKDFKVETADDKLISKKLIGKSKAIQDLKKWIVKFAQAQKPLPVLIFGETGTGKELVAQLIHELSKRSNKPFKAVNCAAIPSELIESELFGHEKGAFTSATSKFEGKFEQANDGTLFLDELGEMSLSAQAKILRAIQEKVITRIGGSNEIDVDVRIIAATNKDLKTIVQKEMSENTAEKFRHDLFYRISGFHIELKPLRERKEDIKDLVEHFAETKTFTPRSIDILESYDWPGNIRELQSFVESLCNLFHNKPSFDKEIVEEALEYWKGQHPDSNYLFSNNNAIVKGNENRVKEVNNRSKSYSSYKPKDTVEIEKRFRILAFAMKHDDDNNETEYFETNLNTLAQRGNKINNKDELRNTALEKMENKTKLQKGFTSSGSGITQWFTKANKDTILKYFAVIDHFAPESSHCSQAGRSSVQRAYV
jgi:DNA-binding NtrC family response regulator